MKLSTYTILETKFAVGKIYVGTAYTECGFNVTRFFFRAVKRTATALVLQFLGSQRQKSVHDEPRIEIAGDNNTQRRKVHVSTQKVESGGCARRIVWQEFRDEICTVQHQYGERTIRMPLCSANSYVD